MKCKEAQSLIAGLRGEDAPSALLEHAQGCPACAELIEFDARMRSSMATEALCVPDVSARIHDAITSPSRSSQAIRLGSLNGKTMIKLTLSSVVAAALVGAFMFAPHEASATSAVTTFKKMKTAVLHAAKQNLSIGIKVAKKADGSIGAWVIQNGNLVEVQPNSGYTYQQDGKNVTVVTESNLSQLTPEMQKMVQDTIKNAHHGNGTDVQVRAIVNGKEVDPSKAKEILHQHGVDLDIQIDLNEDDYDSISFGKDAHNLVLVTKKDHSRRTLVKINPKTNLPTYVTMQQARNGKWVNVHNTSITLG